MRFRRSENGFLLFAKMLGEEAAKFLNRRGGVLASGGHLDRRPLRRRQHEDSHNALAVDFIGAATD